MPRVRTVECNNIAEHGTEMAFFRLFVCLRTYDRPRLGILDSQALELVQAVLARLFRNVSDLRTRNVSDLRTHGPSYTVCR